MKITEPKFEGYLESEEQGRKEAEQKLERFLGEIGEKLRKEGIPLSNDCRIDMEAFSSVYPQAKIKRDQELITDYKKGWEESEDKNSKEGYRKAEKLETLKTALFYKFLGKEFIIARTSIYDDIKNKIDNLILERKTGNLVCAFDEVGNTSGPTYEEKKINVLERDIRKGGRRLKYGLRLEKDEKNQMRLVLGEATGIPIFYLALDETRIDRGIRNLIPSLEEKSDYEENLWNYFVASLNAQIEYLGLEPHLEPILKERLKHFQKALRNRHSKNAN